VEQGPHQGRLLIPCDHSYSSPDGTIAGGGFEYGAHVISSDDGGANWQIGGTIAPKVNECQVVELADGNGTLLMNMRSYFGRNLRTQSISYDGGLSWTDPADVPDLVEPVCQAGLIDYPDPENPNQQILIFTNPASSKFRHNLSIRASFDQGQTWKKIRTIFPGPSAYSSLVALPGNHIGLLFEGGQKSPYESIYFTSFLVDQLKE
jgi:sialidase-1